MSEISIKMFEEPLDDETISGSPQFIQDIIYILYLNTELEMSGIYGVLENLYSHHMPNIITALNNIQATNEANILHEIYEKYKVCPDDESIEKLEDKLYLYTGFNIWDLVVPYVEKERRRL